MEWVKLSTQFYNDPAFDDLTPNAERLFVRCLAFAGAVGTGGVLTQKQIKKVGILNSNRYVSELVQNGLWVQTESGDYRIRSWDLWQESADELEQRRKADRERKARARQVSRDQSRDVRPLEKRREEKKRVDTPNGVSTAGANLDHPLPENWEPDDGTIRTIREECGDVIDLRREHVKFTDHYQGNGLERRNWHAMWRKWMRTAAEDARTGRQRGGPSRGGGRRENTLEAWGTPAAGHSNIVPAEVVELRRALP
jgi:hypothetical protein